MLPSNLNLNIGNLNMIIGPNRDINKDHKKLPMTPPEPHRAEGTALKMDKPIKDHLVVQHEKIGNPKMLAEKHNDEKLAITIFIVGTGLIAYHFC